MNTQIKINHTEPLYTLSETCDVLTWEQRKRQEVYRKKQQYYIVQKLLGTIMIILSLAIIFSFQDDDATPCLVTLFMGTCLVLTKKKGFYF